MEAGADWGRKAALACMDDRSSPLLGVSEGYSSPTVGVEVREIFGK